MYRSVVGAARKRPNSAGSAPVPPRTHPACAQEAPSLQMTSLEMNKIFFSKLYTLRSKNPQHKCNLC